MISAKIVKDSISPDGIRLTTLHLRYPRMIHSEFMTHRVFTRNGRSSRAVPVTTLLKEEGYTPHFMKNKPGMMASEELSPRDLEDAKRLWENLINETKLTVAKLHGLGVHKQWANRPLEWFGWIDTLVTSTDWANWFALRDEEGAQPEIRELAQKMKEAMDTSTPTRLEVGQWHMPYIREEDYGIVEKHIAESRVIQVMPEKHEIEAILRKISTARCARLSYRPFDGNDSIAKELERYERLVVSRPVHASPSEHIATPDTKVTVSSSKLGVGGRVVGSSEEVWKNEKRHGNFYGWQQYRKMIPANTVEDR